MNAQSKKLDLDSNMKTLARSLVPKALMAACQAYQDCLSRKGIWEDEVGTIILGVAESSHDGETVKREIELDQREWFGYTKYPNAANNALLERLILIELRKVCLSDSSNVGLTPFE